ARGRFGAAGAEKDLEETRRIHDARSDRDGVAACSAWARAVPLLEDTPQRLLHALGHAQPPGESAGHLARVEKPFARAFAAVQSPVHNVLCTLRRGLSGSYVRAKPAQHVPRTPRIDKKGVLLASRDLVAQQR